VYREAPCSGASFDPNKKTNPITNPRPFFSAASKREGRPLTHRRRPVTPPSLERGPPRRPAMAPNQTPGSAAKQTSLAAFFGGAKPPPAAEGGVKRQVRRERESKGRGGVGEGRVGRR
jgi:hypothetical protein